MRGDVEKKRSEVIAELNRQRRKWQRRLRRGHPAVRGEAKRAIGIIEKALRDMGVGR